MSEATSSTEESAYQEIFTAFFVGASEAEAHYYSLKPIHDDIPDLARLLGLSQENVNTVLAAGGLGCLQKNGQFIFSKNKFDRFLSKNELEGACELVKRKPKGFGNQHWFIKIGTKSWNDAATPGTKGIGPRIRNLRSLQKDFSYEVCRIASGLLNNQQQIESSETQSDDDEQSDDANEYENSLILLRIKTKLLPLLLKEELLETNFWTAVDANEVEAAMNDIVTEIRQHRDAALSEILGTNQEPVSPNTKENPQLCPTLKKYSIPLGDSRVHQSILKDLYFLNKKQHGTTTLQCNLGDNKMSSFPFIPSSKDYRGLQKNMKRTNWLSSVLAALGGAGNEIESLLNLLTYIGRSDVYRDVWEAAIKSTGLLLPKFDGLTNYNYNNNDDATSNSRLVQYVRRLELEQHLKFKIGISIMRIYLGISPQQREGMRRR
jgi:hypothetical protein